MQTDATIIRRILTGDYDSYSALVDKYQSRCLRFALRYVGDADLAEDVTQETFVRAYRSLDQCRKPDRFESWLYQILVNRCRSAIIRRSERNSRFLGTEKLDDFADPSTLRFSDSESRYDIDYALSRMLPIHREALILKYVEELSYDEISEITNVRVSALKMRVSRASAILRNLLTQKS